MSLTGTTAFVGLGANLGDRAATLERALDEMAALPGTSLRARSAFYETAPVDAGGGDYLNAVACLRTTLAPVALLRALQAIEAAHGRLRPHASAPRSLDLDLLLHGETTLTTAELVLPHPRLHLRAFVLMPLAEIAAGLHVPGHGSVETLLEPLGSQRVVRWAQP